jgi:hypothetical protein
VSNHRQRTQRGPSLVSIVVTGAATLAVIILAFWVITGPVTDQRHLTGGLLGIVLGVLMTSQVVVRVTERQIVTDELRAAADRARRERVLNTGTWLGDQPSQELTVRWDGAAHRYLVQGWTGAPPYLAREREWTDSLDELAEMLTDIERAGELRPIEDEGTRMVRARLALPGWDDVAEPDPVATQPTGTEPAHLQRVPVPLRGEYDGPTRNLSEQARNLTRQARRVRNDWGDRP